MTPLISLLIPSLNRLEFLKTTIASYLDLAAHPDRVEIMLRFHHKDSASIAWGLSQGSKVRVMIGDDAGGYASLHQFCNSLAAMTSGDWLFPTCDDIEMITPEWDRMLAESKVNPVAQCSMANVKIIAAGRAPMLSRRFYEAIGSTGETPHCDCYLDALGNIAGIAWFSEIVLKNLAPAPVDPRNVLKSWDVYRASDVRFKLDCLKLGAVMGKTINGWVPSMSPDLQTDEKAQHAKL